MFRNKLTVAVLATVLALGSVLASCAPASAPAPTAKPVAPAATTGAAPTPRTSESSPPAPTLTPKPAADQPKSGGILNRGNYEDAPHLDIHQATSVNAHIALANVYNGLIRLDPVEINKVIPDLADRWDVSADGKTYTFYLHRDVKWHDGKPFSSEDVKFSVERTAFWKEHKIVSPRAGQLLSPVEKVEAPDANTVKLILKYPSASFLGNLAGGWVLILPKHVIEAKGDMKKDAIGTGPFKWKAWNFGVSQEMVKTPDYFQKGMPYLDGLRIYPIKDDSTRFAAFRTGQVKMTGMGSKALNHVEAERVKKEMADKAVAVSHPAANRYLIYTQFKKKPWDDLRVRQALDLAFDRRAAIAINFNVGIIGASLHPKGIWGIPEEEMVKRPGYRPAKDEDIAKAKSLLAEAGYPNGFKTRLLVRGGGSTEAQGVVAKDQLAKIGIDVTLDAKESTAVYDLLDRHDFELCSFNPSEVSDDPDPVFSAYYITTGSRNYGDYSDPQIDDLFQKQAAMLDEKERKKLVLQIQEKLLEQVVYPVIFWDSYNMGFWKEVKGYTPGFGPYTHNNLDHVWLAK